MKKISSISIFILTVSFGLLNAQTNQGKVLLGGSSTLMLAGTGSDIMSLAYISYKTKSDADDYEESDPEKMTNINLLPKVGYFVVDNLALGLDLNIGLSTIKSGEDNDKYSTTILRVGPFIRYYIPTSKVSPFFEINGSFGSQKVKMEDSDNIEDDEYISSVMSIGGGIGLAAPLGDRVTFDVLAGYYSLTYKMKEDNDDNVRTVLGNLGLRIGFTIFLGAN